MGYKNKPNPDDEGYLIRIILDKLYVSLHNDSQWFGYKKYEMERLAGRVYEARKMTKEEILAVTDWFTFCEELNVLDSGFRL